MRTRLTTRLVGILLLTLWAAGGVKADPITVRALAERVRPAESAEGLPAADEAVVAEMVALGVANARDLTMLLVDVRQSVRLTAIEALVRLDADVATDPLTSTLEHTDLATVEAAALAIGKIASPGSAGILRAVIVRKTPAPAPPRLRRAAIRALPLTGDPKAAELLRPMLTTLIGPDDTEAVVEGLGLARDEESAPAVAALLDDKLRRSATLRSMWAWGSEGVRMLRRDAARRDRDSAARSEVASAALRFGAEGMPLIEDLLRKGDGKTRLTIIQGLATFYDREAVRPVLRRALRDSDAAVVAAALEQLGRDADGGAARSFVQLLEHRDVRVRALAARALGVTTPSSAVNSLTFALSREAGRASAGNLEVRRAILWALGQYRSESVVPALVEGLTVPDQRSTALDAIVETGKAAMGTLMLIVKSGDRRREKTALEAILRIGEAEGRVIASLLRHPDRHARRLGLELTAAVGDDGAVPELSRMVLDPEQPNRLEALRVLSLFYDARLRPVFQDVIASSRDPQLRKTALEAFWRNYDLDAVDYLVGVAEDDEDPEVRVAAIRGLFFLDAAIAPKLFVRMLEYERPVVRQAAADALGLMAYPRQIPALREAIRGSSRTLKPLLVRALRRLARFQGKPEDRFDVGEWYEEYEKYLPRRPSEDDEEDESARPSGVVTLRDGRVLAYWDDGDEDDPAVVAIHDGPDGDPALLRKGLSTLAKDFRVITFAHIDDKLDAWADFSVGREALDLGELCSELEIKSAVVLGHGFGALIAIRYGGMFPRATRKVVLLNAPYPVSASLEGFEEAIEDRLQGDCDEALRWVSGRAGGSLRSVFARRRAWYAFPGLFHNPGKAARFVPEVYDPEIRAALRERLGEFTHEEDVVELRRPVLLVKADDDLYEEALQSRWERLLELKRGLDPVEVIEGCGHHVLLEKKKTTTRIIRDFIED